MAEIELDRPGLSDLTAEQLAPLERLMAPAWSDTWRDLARSQYITLLSLPVQIGEPDALARMAVALTLGIAEDIGGTQPYIPVGSALVVKARTQRVIDLLGQRQTYLQVSAATGITVSQVRKIERAWRRREIEERQRCLPLE